MPIYAYECRKCGEREEYIQKMDDPPMKTCEHCGGRLDKLMTAASFHLKGGGWYADGYSSSGSGTKSDGDAGSKADSSSASSDSSSASSSSGSSASSDSSSSADSD